MSKLRKIIHVDMDAFYASVEQRDNPSYRGKPVVVGGAPEGRGVVAAASYEARRFGIRSAMASSVAVRLCPHVIFVEPRFKAYHAASEHIMSVFHDYTDLVEPLSLDEAYLDVTTNKKSIVYASAVAKEIRRRIYDETKLTASAGVAPNKFLAKIASDMNKPNGLTVITPNDVTRVLKDLPVRAVPGVGRVTEEEMQRHGIFTTGDLLEHSETGLVQLFGKSGHWFYRIARGEDDRPVEPDSERKSVGAEDTFAYDVIEFEELETRLEEVAERVWRRLHDLRGRTVTLKVTYADFEKITRSKTFDRPVGSRDELYSKGIDMLKLTEAGVRPIRLLGLSLHNLVDADTPIVLPPRQLAFPFLEELLRRAPMKRRDGIF